MALAYVADDEWQIAYLDWRTLLLDDLRGRWWRRLGHPSWVRRLVHTERGETKLRASSTRGTFPVALGSW